MKPAKGRYIARDGDIRVENKGTERDISDRVNGKWVFRKTIHWQVESSLISTDIYQRVGVRGLTLYWRKVAK